MFILKTYFLIILILFIACVSFLETSIEQILNVNHLMNKKLDAVQSSFEEFKVMYEQNIACQDQKYNNCNRV